MYTIIFRKGKIELELTTDDKYAVERQLDLIINQANNISKSNQPKQNIIENNTNNDLNEKSIDNYINQDMPNINDNNLHIQPAVFEHIKIEQETTEKKEEQHNQDNIINKTEDVIPQTIDITSVKPITINSIQNPEPQPEPDFDKILTNEMVNNSEIEPIIKDNKFIEYVEGKSAIEKIDFLVITAQYLAQYENMNTFNLKHINAKLMQNFTLIVDHSVLQSAISKELITRVYEGGDDISSEYMLTEKGLRSY